MIAYQRTKIGAWMYQWVSSAAVWLSKHKWLYYLLACTWGILLTLPGVLITLVLLICGKKPIPYYGIYYFEIGASWGGLEMGLMFLRDTTSWNEVNRHELGHSYQNAILGPFMPFLVSIPSAIRYWYQRLKKGPHKPYDAIWFEGSATDIGYWIVKK